MNEESPAFRRESVERRDTRRLQDVLAAVAAIEAHLQRGPLTDGLVYDAVRIRLIEIGEAVKAIDPNLLAQEPTIPWSVAAVRRLLDGVEPA